MLQNRFYFIQRIYFTVGLGPCFGFSAVCTKLEFQAQTAQSVSFVHIILIETKKKEVHICEEYLTTKHNGKNF